MAVIAAMVLAPALAGCATKLTKHGQLFQESDVQQIQPGMNQDQVRMSLGSPNTTSTVNAGSAYYYISSTMRETPWQSKEEIDRKVVAVYFSPNGTVERVAHYGIKDGKVFDFISRQTPSANTNDEGIIQGMFRNLGRRGSIFGDT